MSQPPDEILVNTNVLVVDDEEQNQYLLEVLLKSEKCNVTCAGNGQEALEYLKKDQFHLIISDILMPKMDGFHLCRECKSDPRLKDIPFVFYTATYTDKKDEEFALSLGAERFIRKPEEPKVFIALLREVIKQHHAGHVVAAGETPAEEVVYLKLYNETLIRKLESKMLALEQEVSERRRTEEKLRESEKKYREMYDFLPIPVYEMDFEANITSANRAIYETFGATAEDLKAGFNARQILSPENVDKSNKNIQRMLQGEIIESTEYTLKRIDGSIFPAIVISRVIYSNGKPVGLRGAIVDITERKQAEEKLLASQERSQFLADVLNRSDQPFAVGYPDGRIGVHNPAFCRLTGYTSEELRSMDWARVLTPPEWLQAEMKAVAELESTGKPVRYEKEYIRKDGLRVPIELLTHAAKNARGDTEHYYAFITDIMERKRAEEALRKSEARFRSYFELPLIGIAITSPEKGWLEGNDRLLDILGHSWQELKEMTWSELTYPEDLAADVEQFNRVLAGEIDSYMIEKRFIRKNGEVIWTSLAAGCVRKQDGTVDYFVALFEDITDRKKSVELLRKSLGATVQAMAVTVETRDPYTAGHQRRVADLSRVIATEMGLTADQIDGIRMAAVIHDIGKLSVPAEILSMPRKLTDIEFSLIKIHPRSGYDILKDIEFPWPIARMVLEHHERMDGSGYPQGLTGAGILMESRIISVADVVEAMATHRPYRPSVGLDPALDEISKNKGSHYDPDVVDACLRLFHDKHYRLIE